MEHQLRTLLRDEGVKEDEFARQLGISPEVFYQYLIGFRRPKKARARKISAAVGGRVSPYYLMTFDPKESAESAA